MQKKIINSEEFEIVLKTKFPEYLKKRIVDAELYYEDISSEDRDGYITEVVNVLCKTEHDTDTRPAGEHRIEEWKK
jgi:hypothetical protein